MYTPYQNPYLPGGAYSTSGPSTPPLSQNFTPHQSSSQPYQQHASGLQSTHARPAPIQQQHRPGTNHHLTQSKSQLSQHGRNMSSGQASGRPCAMIANILELKVTLSSGPRCIPVQPGLQPCCGNRSECAPDAAGSDHVRWSLWSVQCSNHTKWPSYEP